MIQQLIQHIKSFFTQESHKKELQRLPYKIKKEFFSQAALSLIERLQVNGFEAYFVGGCVRDLILGLAPKDFDIVTNARPKQIQRLFSRAMIIGRRFTLVHVRLRGELFEVSTFRKELPQQNEDSPKFIEEDNQYGCLSDDLYRRDFTINALYYDPFAGILVDATGGLKDIQTRTLRCIGEPQRRFIEDPVRIVRAARYSAKLQLQLSIGLKEEIMHHAQGLRFIPKARMYEEFLKNFGQSHAVKVYEKLDELKVLRYFIPKKIIQGKFFKEIRHRLKILQQNPPKMKEHHAPLIFLCFLFPSWKEQDLESRLSDLRKNIQHFQQLISVPKQVEMTLVHLLTGERPRGFKEREHYRPLPQFAALEDYAKILM
jgi:poly(A) polymerase